MPPDVDPTPAAADAAAQTPQARVPAAPPPPRTVRIDRLEFSRHDDDAVTFAADGGKTLYGVTPPPPGETSGD